MPGPRPCFCDPPWKSTNVPGSQMSGSGPCSAGCSAGSKCGVCFCLIVSALAAALWDLRNCNYTLEGPQNSSQYSQIGLPPLWEGPRRQDGIPDLHYLTSWQGQQPWTGMAFLGCVSVALSHHRNGNKLKSRGFNLSFCTASQACEDIHSLPNLLFPGGARVPEAP